MAEETRERGLLIRVMAKVVDAYLRKLSNDAFESGHVECWSSGG